MLFVAAQLITTSRVGAPVLFTSSIEDFTITLTSDAASATDAPESITEVQDSVTDSITEAPLTTVISSTVPTTTSDSSVIISTSVSTTVVPTSTLVNSAKLLSPLGSLLVLFL